MGLKANKDKLAEVERELEDPETHSRDQKEAIKTHLEKRVREQDREEARDAKDAAPEE